MKKMFSIATSVLILINMFALLFKIEPASAEWTGTVYIRADGNIDPPGAPIVTFDKKVYTLIGNIVSPSDGIIIEKDDIVLDGAYYTIEGSNTYPSTFTGVIVSGRSNVTIKNMNIKRFYYGIIVNSSRNCSINESHIFYNSIGIAFVNSSYNIVTRNNVTNNVNGVNLGSPYNVIEHNNIINNDCGINVYSSNNTIARNTFVGCGLEIRAYKNNVIYNVVNGKPLVYLEEASNYTISDGGQVILVGCSNISIKDLNLTKASIGVQLLHSSNVTLINNTITYNIFGVLSIESPYTHILENTISYNSQGIRLEGSRFSLIFGNSIINNWHVGLLFFGSYSDIVCANSIKSNMVGVTLWLSKNAKIYHNIFANNVTQIEISNSNNTVWDNGYPSGGNFWSDYIGTDVNRGVSQTEAGSDGIGDSVYKIDDNNVDRYPLMGTFNTFIAGTWDKVTYYVDVVSNATISNYQFNVNQKTISFNVTGDDGTIGFCRVTIPSDLLWVEDGWKITVGNQTITQYAITSDGNFTYLYFSYTCSTKTVTIQGTHVIPEYPSATLLILLIMSSLTAVINNKQGKPKTPHKRQQTS